MLYGPDGPVRPRTFEQPRLGEQHQFRFIVSPEDGGELDLTEYVRELMRRVERDLGGRIEWAAVDHHDTGPSARARRRSRRRPRGPASCGSIANYIASGMRWRAQELATEELGPRHECEIRRRSSAEVTQERFTSLDRELERLADHGRLELASPKRPARV